MSNQGTSITTPPPVVAAVKSPFESKTNWILFLTAALDLLNEVAPIIPPKYQHAVSVSITVIGALLGIMTKTFFTTSISSYSVPSVAPTATVVQPAQVASETQAKDLSTPGSPKGA